MAELDAERPRGGRRVERVVEGEAADGVLVASSVLLEPQELHIEVVVEPLHPQRRVEERRHRRRHVGPGSGRKFLAERVGRRGPHLRSVRVGFVRAREQVVLLVLPHGRGRRLVDDAEHDVGLEVDVEERREPVVLVDGVCDEILVEQNQARVRPPEQLVVPVVADRRDRGDLRHRFSDVALGDVPFHESFVFVMSPADDNGARVPQDEHVARVVRERPEVLGQHAGLGPNLDAVIDAMFQERFIT
mmetsp:Transcript_5619/g.19118  ORF Transcript_5619/g.19118 Transcript_5619/m.19118 type:complete len:246 (-) Transcript_5619:408-1145(-)